MRAAVADWEPMLALTDRIVTELRGRPPALSPDEIEEVVALLEWMRRGRFTFLGYRKYLFQRTSRGELTIGLEPDTGLGLLRDPELRVFGGLRDGRLPPDQMAFLKDRTLLRITQTLRRSTVHRPVSMDTVAVTYYDDDGGVAGAHLFVGLFTSEAFADSSRSIPVLRRKVDRVRERAGLPPGSHSARQLQHVLESYPRTELFQVGEDELYEFATGILHLQDRPRTALFVRHDPFERFVSCLVYLPRDHYDTTMRKRFEEILTESYEGQLDRYYAHVTDSPLARLHYIIRTPRRDGKAPPTEEVEARLVEAARAWEDRLSTALVEEYGEARGLALARRYGGSFPAGYRADYSEQMAVFDIGRMEEVLEGRRLAMNLYRPPDAARHELSFKIYVTGRRTRLSDVVPMLENAGLRVIDERPYEIRPADAEQPVWIRDLALVTEDGRSVDLRAVRDAFHQLFAAVWTGEMENDSFNRLVLTAGIEPRHVTVLRAYSKYLRQARIPFSQSYMRATLGNHPEVARLLVELFLAWFDPEGGEDADQRAAAIVGRIEERLEGVSSLDEDRILRRFLNAIQATLRTNYFQRDGEGRPKPY
ncbi:MAG: NAD-glutamate dehydrogenase, partial [Thermoanaerobaculia bacterium]|nr:NAD-glutamate dehydrogenase [Thermoanaerobaculia bacterium]